MYTICIHRYIMNGNDDLSIAYLSLNVCVCVCKSNATILSLLRRFAEITGFSESEMIGDDQSVCAKVCSVSAFHLQGEVCRSHPRPRATLLGLRWRVWRVWLWRVRSWFFSTTWIHPTLRSVNLANIERKTSISLQQCLSSKGLSKSLNLSCSGKLCLVNDSRIQFAKFLEFLACSRQCRCWFGDCESLRSNLWLLGVAYIC